MARAVFDSLEKMAKEGDGLDSREAICFLVSEHGLTREQALFAVLDWVFESSYIKAGGK